MTNLASMPYAHSLYLNEPAEWKKQSSVQLSLLDDVQEPSVVERSLPALPLKRFSKLFSFLDFDFDTKSYEYMVGSDRFTIETKIDKADQAFVCLINEVLMAYKQKNILLTSFDSKLTHTINASEISKVVGISLDEFEKRMKSLASCSLSAHQHRLLRHTKTGRESFRFVHMFSTKLVSEYVSFDKDGQIFYSFNYAPFFETMFKENLHKKNQSQPYLDQVV
ncbi:MULTISPECIES: hypothetical protein [Acinetobacter]|jgi:hypothetical protein|uniref:Uncharacterized protein n=12 Tax=Acinetobacter calcoaceticus/baumannii complex TaxID=909768 RepID=A0A1E3M5A2_ACIBA|nr:MULTISPECIES: hypothetical protein [Acinetobacter calcoaceticus/baumannii complex]CAH1090740.1 Uncharacterised protein [Acinetobacter phage MD-2021a]AKQ28829.1 hypothetical protein ACX60_18955 [Acinetobacter baumannii]APP30826.1 hypothetical protein AUO97_08380 [Acinetobacter baumannii]APX49295.1 hypothetical protein AT570_08375 [Acinetobacter baumannii]ARG33464.1 hypothetical protein B7L46_00335 [Acinetobacter baumannii]